MADRDLPSVMTCANYLKLPPYSCKVSEGSEGVVVVCVCMALRVDLERRVWWSSGVMIGGGDSDMWCAVNAVGSQEVMREKLMYAICEGQGSFDLS